MHVRVAPCGFAVQTKLRRNKRARYERIASARPSKLRSFGSNILDDVDESDDPQLQTTPQTTPQGEEWFLKCLFGSATLAPTLCVV